MSLGHHSNISFSNVEFGDDIEAGYTELKDKSITPTDLTNLMTPRVEQVNPNTITGAELEKAYNLIGMFQNKSTSWTQSLVKYGNILVAEMAAIDFFFPLGGTLAKDSRAGESKVTNKNDGAAACVQYWLPILSVPLILLSYSNYSKDKQMIKDKEAFIKNGLTEFNKEKAQISIPTAIHKKLKTNGWTAIDRSDRSSYDTTMAHNINSIYDNLTATIPSFRDPGLRQEIFVGICSSLGLTASVINDKPGAIGYVTGKTISTHISNIIFAKDENPTTPEMLDKSDIKLLAAVHDKLLEKIKEMTINPIATPNLDTISNTAWGTASGAAAKGGEMLSNFASSVKSKIWGSSLEPTNSNFAQDILAQRSDVELSNVRI